MAEVRFVDAVPDSTSVRLTIDNKPVVQSTAFGTSTGYAPMPVGDYVVQLQVVRDGRWTSEGIAPLNCTFAPDRQYTSIALGNANNLPNARLQLIDDDSSDQIPSDQSEIRVLNAVPRDTTVDVTINNVVIFSNMPLGYRSKSVLLPAKEYYVKALAPGNFDYPVVGPCRLVLVGGKSAVIVLVPKGPGGTGVLVLTNDQ